MKVKKVITSILIIMTIIMCIPTQALAWIAQDAEPVYENEGGENRVVIGLIMVGIIIVIIGLAMVNSYKRYLKKEQEKNKKEKNLSEQRQNGK